TKTMAESTHQRFITTHNPTTGESIFDASIANKVPVIEYPGGLGSVETHYASEGFPHNLCDDADKQTYQRYLTEPPGICIANGTVLRYVNLSPKSSSPMHRTISVDSGVVVDGTVRLELDSGESKVLKRGDVFVQRATMHAWHNDSETEIARMVVFVQPAAPLEVAGKQLADEFRV
ncbi:hypothetical protein AJ80_03333, partial [Polytolypa hystricis UAMH7299]